ncbi:hypothetical protein [Agrobacterium pusense]|uniref:hypothetical protein n=1 Tax=Agrobacterium pusense TaxID=648995 RepID=UPI000D399EA3|nr:hypothetical protein [Agrobacterium pusense]PTV71641.1 hypothetical protein DBL06_23440 [Agrobacterium pusense]
MHENPQLAASDIALMATTILSTGMKIARPVDVVDATTLQVDEKRTILAAWASDLYTIDSRPAYRHMPGTPEPVSIDEVQAALSDLDRRYGS